MVSTVSPSSFVTSQLYSLIEQICHSISQNQFDPSITIPRRLHSLPLSTRNVFHQLQLLSQVVGEGIVLDAFHLATGNCVRLLTSDERQLKQGECTDTTPSPIVSPSVQPKSIQDKWLSILAEDIPKKNLSTVLQIYEVSVSTMSTDKGYVLPGTNWCCCEIFEKDVLSVHKSLTCSHWLAVQLSISLGLVDTVTTKRNTIKGIMKSFSDHTLEFR